MAKDKSRYFTGFYNYHEKICNELDKQYLNHKITLDDFLNIHDVVSFEKAKKMFYAEIEARGYLGDTAIYSFALDIFNDDSEKAKAFLISQYGGFSKTEVSDFKSYYNSNRKKTIEKHRLNDLN